MKEQLALAGKWIAMEVYGRDTQPRRVIAAIADSPAECIRKLIDKGLDPAKFELRPMKRPM